MTNPTGTTHGQSSTSYRVIVTGSRTWPTASPIRLPLALLLQAHGSLTIVVGDASQGVDRFVKEWCDEMAAAGRLVKMERHEAYWGVYGRAAGPLRNKAMVNAGADECLAYIRDNSPGATHCAQAAQTAGIPTTIHRWPT